jgi:H+/Cl- antiporter ClcA
VCTVEREKVDGGEAFVRLLGAVVGVSVLVYLGYGVVPELAGRICTTCTSMDILWITFAWVPLGMLVFGLMLCAALYWFQRPARKAKEHRRASGASPLN